MEQKKLKHFTAMLVYAGGAVICSMQEVKAQNATTNTQTFALYPNQAPVQSNGTSSVTVFTAGTVDAGKAAKCDGLMITSTFTAATTVFLFDVTASATIAITSVSVPALAGNVAGTNAINALSSGVYSGAVDGAGNLAISYMASESITATLGSATPAAKIGYKPLCWDF